MLKVGYLGPEGTYSEEASILYAKKIDRKDIKFIPFSTFHDVLSAVDSKKVNEGVLPIENSIEGTVGIVEDILVKDVNLKIYQEIVIPVHQCLIANKGVTISDITDVVSHPQPIEQCRQYLRKTLPNAELHLAHSTSSAVKQIAASDKKTMAAIGPEGSAKLYGLVVLKKDINDYTNNRTRFIVVSKKDHPATGCDKTSIAFSIAKDKPGGLYNILGEFALRNINLNKIESRPAKTALGNYYFFADFDGHKTDKKVKDALSAIKKKASFLKIFGSYPKAKE